MFRSRFRPSISFWCDFSHGTAYLRTYDIVHGGLIAAAQMRAVEADHNQTAVEGLRETEMKVARLILGQISWQKLIK